MVKAQHVQRPGHATAHGGTIAINTFTCTFNNATRRPISVADGSPVSPPARLHVGQVHFVEPVHARGEWTGSAHPGHYLVDNTPQFVGISIEPGLPW